VANAADHACDGKAASYKADEIAGTHNANGQGRKSLGFCPKREQRCLQTIAREQDSCTEEQGAKLCKETQEHLQHAQEVLYALQVFKLYRGTVLRQRAALVMPPI
jgi:hypothetical protein